MRRVWLIRAGENAEAIDSLRNAGLIGVRADDIGDVRELTPEQIKEAMVDDGRASAPTLRSMVFAFARDARRGDLVVSPNPSRREVWVGTIAGEYERSDDPRVDGFAHSRAVDWIGWLDRDAAWIREQIKSLDRPQVLYELSNREWWWDQVDAREFTAAPRSRLFAPPAAPRARKQSTTSTPAPVRKAPPALVRCAGSCGFQWAPSSLVDGLCYDCRNE
jgi:hypothetical protein